MTRKEQLNNELDEMKGFIDACEIAIDYSLGLDKDTYEKYEAAIKRRAEINDQLDQFAQRKPYGVNSGLFTSATMQRKVSDYPLDRCKIEALVILEHEDFENFRNNLLSDYDFIKENIDSKLVYIYLFDRCDKEKKAWPSIKRIAKDLSISEKTVRRAVKDLEKAGLIRKEYAYRKNGSFTSNRYYLL